MYIYALGGLNVMLKNYVYMLCMRLTLRQTDVRGEHVCVCDDSEWMVVQANEIRTVCCWSRKNAI